MNPELLFALPGLAVAAWYVARCRRDRDPLGEWPTGALPDTTVPFVAGMAAWFLGQGFLPGFLAGTELGREGGTTLSTFTVAVVNALIAAALIPFASKGTRKPHLGPGAILAAGALAAVVVVAAQFALGLAIQGVSSLLDFDVQLQPVVDEARKAGGAEVVTLAVSAVVLAPFAEEVFFRGMMLPAFARVMDGQAALVLQAVFFGAIHVGSWSTWPLAIPLAFVGWAAGWIYLRTGSIAAPIALHAAFNAVNFTLLRTI